MSVSVMEGKTPGYPGSVQPREQAGRRSSPRYTLRVPADLKIGDYKSGPGWLVDFSENGLQVSLPVEHAPPVGVRLGTEVRISLRIAERLLDTQARLSRVLRHKDNLELGFSVIRISAEIRQLLLGASDDAFFDVCTDVAPAKPAEAREDPTDTMEICLERLQIDLQQRIDEGARQGTDVRDAFLALVQLKTRDSEVRARFEELLASDPGECERVDGEALAEYARRAFSSLSLGDESTAILREVLSTVCSGSR